MRSVLERQVPEAQLLAGRAEEIPLPDGSLDAIVAGQAFHWFDGPGALAEFHRLLRPGEHLGLIWNRRDSTQPVHQAIDEIIERKRRDTPAYHRNEWATVFDDNPWFEAADQTEVTSEQILDEDGLVDRVLSISYIAALEPDERDRVEEQLRALAAGGLEPLRHRTQAFSYRRLD
jgi:SAM-dependent methyltransferase